MVNNVNRCSQIFNHIIHRYPMYPNHQSPQDLRKGGSLHSASMPHSATLPHGQSFSVGFREKISKPPMAILGMVHCWHYSKYNFPLFHLYHDSPIIILSLSHRCPYWKEITPHVSSNKSQNNSFIFYYIVSHYSTYMEVSISGDPNSWML